MWQTQLDNRLDEITRPPTRQPIGTHRFREMP
jgi:hypothetical protein